MKLIDLAKSKMKNQPPGLTESQKLYNSGWDGHGEWTCANCGRMIGKNLLGDSPFLLARQHAEECNASSEA